MTVDWQIATLKTSGADALLSFASLKLAAPSILRACGNGWKSLHLMASTSIWVEAVQHPVGLEKSVGLMSSTFAKAATDLQRKGGAALRQRCAMRLHRKQRFRIGELIGR